MQVRREDYQGFRRSVSDLRRKRLYEATFLTFWWPDLHFTKKVHYRYHNVTIKATTTSPSLIRFPALRRTTTQISARKAEDFESVAQLVEDLIPHFTKAEERQFYREVVQSYRAVARDVLRKVWSDDKRQGSAKRAVILAVILVIVVGTIRLIGSNADTVFSQAANSIQ